MQQYVGYRGLTDFDQRPPGAVMDSRPSLVQKLSIVVVWVEFDATYLAHD
jgi:hypothetical protein